MLKYRRLCAGFMYGAVIFSIFADCYPPTEPITNPHNSWYEGDYSYHVSWADSPRIHGDTFEVFEPYELKYFTTGRDSFFMFTASTTPTNVVDSSFIITGNHDWERKTSRMFDSSLVIYLDAPLVGRLKVSGIRPNDNTVDTSMSIVVKNPYRIERSPNGYSLKIIHDERKPISGSIDSVVWYMDDRLFSSKKPDEQVTVEMGPKSSVFAVLFDTLKNSISTDTIILTEPTGDPTTTFEPDSIFVPVGVENKIKVIKGNCDSVFWSSTVPGLSQTTYGDSLFVTFPSIGHYLIVAQGKTIDGKTGSPDSLHVVVFDDKPRVNSVSVSPLAALVGDTVTIRVTASAWGNKIDSVLMRSNVGVDTSLGVSESDSIDVSVRVVFDAVGKYLIMAAVFDTAGRRSEFVSASDSIAVTSGDPVVTGISPDTVYIRDDTLYTIHATDPGAGGSVVQWFVRWEDGGDFIEYSDSAVQHRFDQPGTYTVELYVADNDGNISETVSDLVTVLRGMPTVEIDAPVSAWVHDEIELVLHGADTNGTVQQYAVSWDDGVFTTQADSLFTHTFSDSGEKSLIAYVVDEDGNSSDTVSTTVTVSLGEPGFTSITTDSSMSRLFVLDPITWTITGTDPNGSVDSVLVSWDGDTVFESRAGAGSGSASFEYAFGRTLSGTRTLLFRLVDNDGLTTDSAVTVDVRLGAPVIDSLLPDTVWVVDNNTYTVFAHDTNGMGPDSFEIDWNNDGTYDARNATGTFSHAFDTSEHGERPVKVRVMDEDSIWSDEELKVMVRQGRPVVSGTSFGDSIQWVEGQGGALDTMFYVYKGGNTFFAVDTSDTNGECVKFYWDFENDGVDEVTIVPMWNQSLVVNTPRRMAAWCKDDDSISSEKLHFWIYPDEPPDSIVATSDAIPGGRKFSWAGMDVKDSLETEYRILVHRSGDGGYNQPDSSRAADIAKDWTPGSASEFNYHAPAYPGGPTFDWEYRPPDVSGKYYYQIEARDARGSVTRGIFSLGTFDYTAP